MNMASAESEHSDFTALLEAVGITVVRLGDDPSLTPDSIYCRDALVLTPKGLLQCRMGKLNRVAEPAVNSVQLAIRGFGARSAFSGSASIEGGDVVWLEDDLCALGISGRTNETAARELTEILGAGITTVHVHLHSKSMPGYVIHLSSALSVVAPKVVLIDPRYLPVSFLQFLDRRSYTLIEVAEREAAHLACNVLPIGYRHVCMISGSPLTEERLRATGIRVAPIRGDNVGVAGNGGPTCLVCPIQFEC
jgi:N-dimethylarginine dimethylaminohydrolase